MARRMDGPISRTALFLEGSGEPMVIEAIETLFLGGGSRRFDLHGGSHQDRERGAGVRSGRGRRFSDVRREQLAGRDFARNFPKCDLDKSSIANLYLLSLYCKMTACDLLPGSTD